MNLKNRKLFELILGCVFLLNPTYQALVGIFTLIKIRINGPGQGYDTDIGGAILNGALMITGALLIINSYKK
jgi:hypothetical protein